MLVRRNLGLLVVGTALGFAFVTACSGSSKSSNSSSSSNGPDKTCSQTTCNLPPTAPQGAPQANGSTATVLAVKTLDLGDSSPTAWETLGYNLDGLVSTPHGTNHCKPAAGANPKDVKTDGKGGIDNSFGENLIPLIKSLVSDPSQSVNTSIADGSFTVMVKMDNVDSQKNQTGVKASLYGGANMGSKPLWDGTDQWPVLPELLNNGNKDDPKVKFPNSYVADDTWVSGSKADISLNLAVQGQNLALDIVNAVITMKLSGDRKSASDGIIAGVINTENLISELKLVAGSFSKNLCGGSTFDSIAQEIRAASDIMANGTNGDPTKTCDAISVGIGFTASAVQLGKVAPPSKGKSNPCGGAGGTSAGGSGGTSTGGSGGSSGGAGGTSAGGAGGADAGI